ncbi:hypothetical protein J7L68_05080 [bacterium]|nr:hypothetical protein [bacterium]
MIKFSKYRRNFDVSKKKDNNEQDENLEYVNLGRIDRSKYPKSIFWIIFAAAGVVLLWMVIKFLFILMQH